MLLPAEELQKLLTDIEILDEAKMKKVHQFMKDAHTDFEDALLQMGVISDEKLGIVVANHLKIPFVSLAKITIPEAVSHIVPEKIARRKKVVAFERSPESIKLAMADPRNTALIRLIEQKTLTKVSPYLATERDIANTLYIYKKDLQKAFDRILEEAHAKGHQDYALAKMVDLMIETAYYDKVSDVHIEPQEESAIIRFRIDGILHDVVTYPKHVHERVTTRIKVLSQLRTDEHLSPQDGKLRMQIEGAPLDLRVSIIPIVTGEKIVLRVLSTQNQQITLSDLGMSDIDLEKVSRAYTKSYGMILSTGPTGSGKSTSIYSILKILNTRSKNITTIEDPVEYRIEGLNQIQVNAKANLTFASGLRSILRQDPNIILVGEIRDSETANIAVNAALTGHLVVSTLHTNDAATALPRLMDMKIEPFLVASTINVIIAQRLVRKICEMCKAQIEVSFEDFEKNLPKELIVQFFGKKKALHIYHGEGCPICHQTGYTGRVALFEVLEVTKGVRDLILKKADSDVIMRQAKSEGMTTMLEDGLVKVASGVTTIEEVLRVTKVESLA